MNIHRRKFVTNSYANNVLNLDPVAYWPMNETTGTVVNDLSGNGYAGSWSGSTLNQVAFPGSSMGSAAQNDRINDYQNMYSVSFAADASFRDEGSFFGWYRQTNTTGAQYLVSLKDTNFDINIVLWAGFITFSRTGATGGLKTTSGTGSSPNLWSSFCFTWSVSKNELIGYLNNNRVASPTTGINVAGTGSLASTTTNFSSFNATPLLVFGGNSGHFSLYNRALNKSEIAILSKAK